MPIKYMKKAIWIDVNCLAFIIGMINIIMGLALLPSISRFDQLDLFNNLSDIARGGWIWAGVFCGIGMAGILAMSRGTWKQQIIVYSAIIVFWFWMASGWSRLDYIPPHGFTTFLINTVGGGLVITRRWKERVE